MNNWHLNWPPLFVLLCIIVKLHNILGKYPFCSGTYAYLPIEAVAEVKVFYAQIFHAWNMAMEIDGSYTLLAICIAIVEPYLFLP